MESVWNFILAVIVIIAVVVALFLGYLILFGFYIIFTTIFPPKNDTPNQNEEYLRSTKP